TPARSGTGAVVPAPHGSGSPCAGRVGQEGSPRRGRSSPTARRVGGAQARRRRSTAPEGRTRRRRYGWGGIQGEGEADTVSSALAAPGLSALPEPPAPAL